MRIAILGATSEIAKDLILSFAKNNEYKLVLFARRPQIVEQWLTHVVSVKTFDVCSFEQFKNTDHFDAIINFVGVGNPAKAVTLGAGIFEITTKYDDLAMKYIEANQACKYIFLSSGATYGTTFESPADENTKTQFAINQLQPQDWYGIAKLHAECRHRALPHLAITDLRVFNYFSHTQDMNARFLMTDIVRAIKNNTLLETSASPLMRDYLHPSDFHHLITLILTSAPVNTSVDCYSKKPISKIELLAIMKANFNLNYKMSDFEHLQATGQKPNYFSVSKKAKEIFQYMPAYSSEETLQEQTMLSICS